MNGFSFKLNSHHFSVNAKLIIDLHHTRASRVNPNATLAHYSLLSSRIAKTRLSSHINLNTFISFCHDYNFINKFNTSYQGRNSLNRLKTAETTKILKNQRVSGQFRRFSRFEPVRNQFFVRRITPVFHTDNAFLISISLQLIAIIGVSYYGTKNYQTGPTFIMSCGIGETMITTYKTFKNTSFKTVCTKKVCTCENGSGATGIFCWEHLKKGCFNCEPGFYKTLRDHSQIKNTKDISETSVSPPIYSCEQIECTCLNGIAKIGRNCYKHGKLSCEKCDENYKLVEVSPFIFECSKEVECSCFSGDVLENSLCTNAEPEKCSSCKPFYHLNETNLKCEINRCSCENGYPLYQCKVNLDQNCLFCDAGHHLENTDISNVKHCSKNMCSCKHGYSPNSTNSKPCPNHESEFCAECFQSHQNFAGNCVEKTCVCLNGHPSQKRNCPETGAHHCSSCNNHYELGKNTAKCYPKVYSSCSPSPCENSGVCLVLSPEYVECDCTNGFTGPFCDKVNHCFKSAPCLNDGICKLDYSTDRGYICGCSEGYVGYNCETDLSEPCACPNGAQCSKIDKNHKVGLHQLFRTEITINR